jgi:hypothetical protein
VSPTSSSGRDSLKLQDNRRSSQQSVLVHGDHLASPKVLLL